MDPVRQRTGDVKIAIYNDKKLVGEEVRARFQWAIVQGLRVEHRSEFYHRGCECRQFISRKGAKAQRNAKAESGDLALRLCAFA
jgi:hypothetical protein